MKAESKILTSQSRAIEARQAVQEFHDAVWQPDMALVVFFCSSEYDLRIVADEMSRRFEGTQVVGCTTAGEIGPKGYCEHSLSGASFPAGAFTVAVDRLDHLQNFTIADGQALGQSLLDRLETSPENRFAMLLIDGLSVREEQVTRALQHALGAIPLVGGSAGDGLRFEKTYVFHDGQFHTDSAVLVLAATELPFKAFKTQHFSSTDRRLVVTEADPETRTVKEINGVPAAAEYARLVGADPEKMDSHVFATSPVVVVIDGTNYVRSIQKANPDGSLTFYCAIEEGLVLRIAVAEDLVQNLESTFGEIRADIGESQFTFGCDCILRFLEITHGGLRERVGSVLQAGNTIGFSTYGEQFGGVHVNQTFAGIAIGTRREGSDE